MAFSLDSKVKDILKNPAAAAALDKYSPDASRNPQMEARRRSDAAQACQLPAVCISEAPSGGAGQGLQAIRMISELTKTSFYDSSHSAYLAASPIGEPPIYVHFILLF